MQTSTAASPTSTRPTTDPGWTTYRTRCEFLDPTRDNNFAMRWQRLEVLLKNNPICCTSRVELMSVLGCSKNTLTAFLREAEKGDENGPFLTRVKIPYSHASGFTERIGIIMHRRATDRPVVPNDAASVRKAEALLKSMAKRRVDRNWTIPYPLTAQQDAPTVGGGATQPLGGGATQPLGSPTIGSCARPEDQYEDQEKNDDVVGSANQSGNIHACDSSSFFDPGTEERQDAAPVTPKPKPINPPAAELAVDQTELADLVAIAMAATGSNEDKARREVSDWIAAGNSPDKIRRRFAQMKKQISAIGNPWGWMVKRLKDPDDDSPAKSKTGDVNRNPQSPEIKRLIREAQTKQAVAAPPRPELAEPDPSPALWPMFEPLGQMLGNTARADQAPRPPVSPPAASPVKRLDRAEDDPDYERKKAAREVRRAVRTPT